MCKGAKLLPTHHIFSRVCGSFTDWGPRVKPHTSLGYSVPSFLGVDATDLGALRTSLDQSCGFGTTMKKAVQPTIRKVGALPSSFSLVKLQNMLIKENFDLFIKERRCWWLIARFSYKICIICYAYVFEIVSLVEQNARATMITQK